MTARVYLDHAASAPLALEAREAMLDWLDCANPSALHASGRKAATALTEAREEMARFLGVRRADLTFASGGTEANNLAVLGLAARFEGGHLLASPTEHPSIIEPLRWLARSPQWELEWLEVDAWGQVEPSVLQAAIRPDTRLVAVQWANNETGLIQPVEEIARACRAAAVPLLVDAAQAAPIHKLRPEELGIDLLTLSAHKFHGPKGAGLLYCREGLELKPHQHGGGQERGLRSGTENLPALVGMAAAAKTVAHEREARQTHLETLRRTLDGALAGLGEPVLPPEAPRLPQIASYRFEGHKAQRLLMRLDLEGFEAGSGSACAIGQDKPSHVLAALGFSSEQAGSALRFSLGKDNRPEQLESLGSALSNILEGP